MALPAARAGERLDGFEMNHIPRRRSPGKAGSLYGPTNSVVSVRISFLDNRAATSAGEAPVLDGSRPAVDPVR